MTPLNVTDTQLTGAAAIADGYIPSAYDSKGQYLWIWVTWGINIQYTYIDPYCGQLPEDNDPERKTYDTPRYTKDLFASYVPFKEHYPLIRGRTTVIETRSGYDNLIDGKNGEITWGSVAKSPERNKGY
jgi:hypothetical protein